MHFKRAAFILLVPLIGLSQCPSWLAEESVPVCPKANGILPLSDNYPALAHVISDNSMLPSLYDWDPYATALERNFPADFVLKTLKASGERTPLFFLPVKHDTFDYIKSQVSNSKVDAETKKRWLASLIYVPNDFSFTWQQDYFESFYDP